MHCRPPVIDALLAGADRVQALLDDVEHSNDADVSEPLARLRTSRRPTKGSQALRGRPARSPPFALTEAPMAQRPPDHGYLYGVRVELAECKRKHGLAPLAVIRRVQAVGALLNAGVDAGDADLAAGLPAGQVWYQAVVSATLPPPPFSAALDVPGAEIVLLEPASAPPPPPPTREEGVGLAPPLGGRVGVGGCHLPKPPSPRAPPTPPTASASRSAWSISS